MRTQKSVRVSVTESYHKRISNLRAFCHGEKFSQKSDRNEERHLTTAPLCGIIPMFVKTANEIKYAGVMELVDVTDSKSVGGNIVWVRVPPPAPENLL